MSSAGGSRPRSTQLPTPDPFRLIDVDGEVVVAVPITEFRRLRALERAASQEALEEAEDTAAWQEWERREAAGLTRYVPADEVRRHASPEALVAAADLAGLADRRRTRPAELG